jgi:hypothetical protein
MKSLLIACLALTALLAGCGGANVGPNSNEKRGEAVTCMTEKHGLDARMVGDDVIQVGDPETGPRVRFFLTRGQAEGAQFEGNAEGTLQSGAALIYVRRNSDEVLEKVEDCIDSL